MSDNADLDGTKDLLLKINEIVSKMDPAVRLATFDILVARYISKRLPAQKQGSASNSDMDAEQNEASFDTGDLGSFISSFDTKKPVDALNVLVAWLYSQHGAQAFSIKTLKELADSCGLTIPSRADMTFKGAKKGGKSLFMQSGKNWKLTVSGELHVKDLYKVTKGNAVVSEE